MNWTAEEQNQHREDWCEALESGAYQQTHGVLRRGDTFSSLGVACEIFRQNVNLGWWKDSTASESTMKTFNVPQNNWGPLAYECSTQMPPDIVKVYFGMFYVEGAPSGHIALTDLLRLDENAAPFAEVAEFIRRES